MDAPNEEVLEYLVQRARERLALDPRTSELEVRVSVAGHKVFLHGSVTTDERRHAITDVVTESLPGYEVHNQMTLLDLTPAGEAEELS